MPFVIFRRDHLRFTPGNILRFGIICGPIWGSFPVWGSFAVGDHLRRCTVYYATTAAAAKSHAKMDLCVSFGVLRLFRVGPIVQSKRSALSLAWNEWFSCEGKEWKNNCSALTHVVGRASNMKVSRRHLADYVKKIAPQSRLESLEMTTATSTP